MLVLGLRQGALQSQVWQLALPVQLVQHLAKARPIAVCWTQPLLLPHQVSAGPDLTGFRMAPPLLQVYPEVADCPVQQ